MAKKASGSNSYVSMQNITKSTNWQLLQKAIIQGFPDHRHQLPEECRRYWNTRHQLTIDDGLIVYSCCLVIPTKMWQEVLHQLHESHQELVRTKQRAWLAVYWPGIDNDWQYHPHMQEMPRHPTIKQQRADHIQAKIRKTLSGNRRRPLFVWRTRLLGTGRLLHRLAGDYPNGPRLLSSHLIKVIQQSFCRTGVPDTLWSDQGTTVHI